MTQITEDYCNFETAKLLKEKGFDDNCAALYDIRNGEFREKQTGYVFNNSQWENFITAPTLQMAMKWLRDTFHLEIYPYHNYDNSKWWYEIIKYPNSVAEYECGKDEELNTYEKACEAAIKYCLEKLI